MIYLQDRSSFLKRSILPLKGGYVYLLLLSGLSHFINLSFIGKVTLSGCQIFPYLHVLG